MAKSRAELVTQALKHLRLIGEGQSASDHDRAEATAAIDPLIARLRQMDVYNVTNSQSFSDAASDPLSRLLAQEVAYLIGQDKNMTAVTYYEDQLRRMQNQPLEGREMWVDRALLRRRRTTEIR